jgi:hypothetical protein
MDTILYPVPLTFEVLPRGDLRHRTDDRHEIALARHFDPHHTEAALRALKGDPLDDSGKTFTTRVLVMEIRYHALPGLLPLSHILAYEEDDEEDDFGLKLQ